MYNNMNTLSLKNIKDDQGRWGRGAPAPLPPEGLFPPRTFTGLIFEEQLEYYGINT